MGGYKSIADTLASAHKSEGCIGGVNRGVNRNRPLRKAISSPLACLRGSGLTPWSNCSGRIQQHPAVAT